MKFYIIENMRVTNLFESRTGLTSSGEPKNGVKYA